jgi:4-aminobutyrate aminotransferase-like enzyme
MKHTKLFAIVALIAATAGCSTTHTFIISPPLTLTKAHADEMVEAIDKAMAKVD